MFSILKITNLKLQDVWVSLNRYPREGGDDDESNGQLIIIYTLMSPVDQITHFTYRFAYASIPGLTYPRSCATCGTDLDA
jgi:hypothetical protein